MQPALTAAPVPQMGALVSAIDRSASSLVSGESALVSVWIFDPHPIVRTGIRSQLEGSGFAVMGEFAHPVDAASRAERHGAPGIVILDAIYGTAPIGDMKKRFPGTQVVVFAEHAEISCLAAAFEAGADGYILKSISAAALLDSLRLVRHGEKVFPSTLTCFLASYRHAPAEPAGGDCKVGNVVLSDREMGILRGLAHGHTNKRIAKSLNITEATVKVNLKAVLRKLGMTNRTQVAIWAVQNRLHSEDIAEPIVVSPVESPKVESLQ